MFEQIALLRLDVRFLENKVYGSRTNWDEVTQPMFKKKKKKTATNSGQDELRGSAKKVFWQEN